MSLNTVLIQLVLFWCVLMLLRIRQIDRGWVVISGFILLVLAGAYYIVPQRAGWISGGLWMTFVVVPTLGFTKVRQLVSQEQYRQARSLASSLRWLHPIDGWFAYPTLLRGLELGQQNKLDEAIQLFKGVESTKTVMGRMATVLLYKLLARWDEFTAWVQTNLSEKTLYSDQTVAICYLRSLGETGDINGLLLALERLQKSKRASDSLTIDLARMYALAFCGQVDQVQKAFKASLLVYPDTVRQFWVATAELAAGNETARQQLLELRDRVDAGQQNAIDWRLSHPPVNLNQTLTDSSRTILIALRTDIRQESHYSLRTIRKGQKTPTTFALIAANCLMFAVEEGSGGSENLDTLYRLGALIPEAVFAGEWWRILSANFLHLNWLHLLANMVGLYVLGRIVEARLGTLRFLMAYFFSGIGSMVTIAVLSILTQIPELICVGASGAIMGLLGVIAAILMRGWRRENITLARNQLIWILGLVGLQMVSDWLIPEASMVGHVSGLILGFIVGYFLSAIPRKSTNSAGLR